MNQTTNKQVRQWSGGSALTKSAIWALMHTEGLRPSIWSSTPNGIYDCHTASYHRIIWVAEGSVTFELPDNEQLITLKRGDRLDLAPGIAHQAQVGPDGMVCLEARRRTEGQIM